MGRRGERLGIFLVHQGADMYGSDVVFAQVVHAVSEQHDVKVVLAEDGPLIGALRSDGIDVMVRPLGVVRRELATPSGLRRLATETRRGARTIAELAADFSADVIYSNTLAVLSGALAAKRMNIPHIWHVHETIESPWVVAKTLAGLARERSDTVIAVSDATAHNLERFAPGVSKKTIIVRNGIDYSAFDKGDGSELRHELGISSKESLIVLVGRISGRKGQEVLVDAFSRLDPEIVSQARLMFVGDVFRGNEGVRDRLFEMIDRRGLSERVNVMGYRDDIPNVMAASDIVVVPSVLPESAPTVALEAMAARKPVIASGVGGLPEIVGDRETGLLVYPGDVDALCGALTTLLEDEQMRTSMGDAGRSRVEREFSIEAFDRAVVDIIEDVVKARRGRKGI